MHWTNSAAMLHSCWFHYVRFPFHCINAAMNGMKNEWINHSLPSVGFASSSISLSIRLSFGEWVRNEENECLLAAGSSLHSVLLSVNLISFQSPSLSVPLTALIPLNTIHFTNHSHFNLRSCSFHCSFHEEQYGQHVTAHFVFT